MYDIAILLCLIVRESFYDFWILRGQNLNFEVIFLEENDVWETIPAGGLFRRGDYPWGGGGAIPVGTFPGGTFPDSQNYMGTSQQDISMFSKFLKTQ